MAGSRHHGGWRLAAAVALLGVLAWQGHRVAHLLPQVETWLEGLGPWGPILFILALAVLEPLFVPDSIFGLAAGVAFGLGAGTAWVMAGNILCVGLVYGLGRTWLRRPVLDLIARRPALEAIRRVAEHDALRVTLLVRLVPFNPALISYALGAIGVPFRAYTLGTLGLLPHQFLTVYLGATAAHVTAMAGTGHTEWGPRGVVMLVGLALSVLLMVGVVRHARAELARLEAQGQPAD